MSKSKKEVDQPSSSLILVRPSLSNHMAADESFPSAYFRAVGAIASSDGAVNIAEYSVLNEILHLSGYSSLAGVMLLHVLDNPLTVKDAFNRLSKASKDVDDKIRRACFEAAKPLLVLQGENCRGFAEQLAKGLNLHVSDPDLDELATVPGDSLWNMLATTLLRSVKGKGLAEFAEECHRVTGQEDILKMMKAFRQGKVSGEELRGQIINALDVVSQELSSYEKSLEDAELSEENAREFVAIIKELDNQINQRLGNIVARIEHERRIFCEDIVEAVHDAGNAFELEVSERLSTDQWKKGEVWESIARSSFGKELERRVNIIVNRREQTLRLFDEELRLFRNEMGTSYISILQRQHHSRFSKGMPPLRLQTTIKNRADQLASATLGVGALMLAGTGVAIYIAGATVVWPVLAPFALKFTAAMLVPVIIKWFSSPEARKKQEILHKRQAFEKQMSIQLEMAQESFNEQLARIADAFYQTASEILRPLLLEAQAAEQLSGYQEQTAKRLIKQSRTVVTRLSSELATLSS